ncbi:MAG: c-type cytochrome [Alphaproteobacteria bacterium]
MHRPLIFAAFFSSFIGSALAAGDSAAIQRGEYIFNAAGCAGCHTDIKSKGPLLGGGQPLDTPFGRFFGPNISPDPDHGIGGWSDEQFVAALKTGISPAGKPYYPAFPFTSFSKANRQDLLDLKAYIFSLPPVAQPSRPHELNFPFNWRPLLWAWRFLNFEPTDIADDPNLDPQQNRGRYLVEALTHCGECHTPRNALGASDTDRKLAGTTDGPEGKSVPNISPHQETGIGSWGLNDITALLKSGLTPEYDSVGASMGEVVEQGTSKMLDEDLAAIAAYLLSLPPIDNKIAATTGE